MEIVDRLLAAYRSQFSRVGYPPWAFEIRPSIPFVGKNYQPGSGLLIYASAENLSSYRGGFPDWLRGEEAWNRHRWQFEEWRRKAPQRHEPFPNVHIQPVTDGGLLVAAALILSLDGKMAPADRAELTEILAIANFGKFAVKAEQNKDYAGSLTKLDYSVPYVAADLSVLKPRLLLVPKTIWRRRGVQAALRSLTSRTKVLPVWQCQAKVINIYCAQYEPVVPQLRRRFESVEWSRWIDDLPGAIRGHFWRYLAAVEEAMTRA